jgi:hypothetical protein
MRPAPTRSGRARRPRLGPKRASAKKMALGIGPGLRGFCENENGAKRPLRVTDGLRSRMSNHDPVAGGGAKME